jgi:predicted DNA-binding transcriptional regulator AlpA
MRRFLHKRDLKGKGVSYSEAQLDRLSALPDDDPRKFPSPVKGLGKERVYLEDEVDAYIERRLAARAAEQAA